MILMTFRCEWLFPVSVILWESLSRHTLGSLLDIKRNMNIGGVVFPLEQQSRDDESVVYHGQYDTEGVPHTKSGDRQPVQVSIEFIKAGTFETVWQAKYYNYYKREHCQFGNKFSSIEYECKPNETRTLMWINKEAFN
ncbi:CB1 cannabinoid receptor-interacting protein 1a isoform X2 [Simochromis diagramma]|uniref:CB1 cannabinoid receptor-interacting protein 1a isoform X2 n=1 Tax=Simochromis diagramma TaxID=43689 RepID=UPI001A7EFBA4|nr:CB1 cannabinoid receptor-interacting protein 1a isoform X2 [Simochromis diagramma]